MHIRRLAREAQVLIASAAIITVGLLQAQLSVMFVLATVVVSLLVAWNGVSATVREH